MVPSISVWTFSSPVFLTRSARVSAAVDPSSSAWVKSFTFCTFSALTSAAFSMLDFSDQAAIAPAAASGPIAAIGPDIVAAADAAFAAASPIPPNWPAMSPSPSCPNAEPTPDRCSRT